MTDALDYLGWTKAGVTIALLTLLWCWETWRPFFGQREGRLPHGVCNLALALTNTLLLAGTFGFATTFVARWTAANEIGLLHALALPEAFRWLAALVLLDAWMYAWHRANHALPLLWRFHRVHHSDAHMDVTTATRFHLGEHVGAASLRLGLIVVLGLDIWHVIAYETLVIAVTQFHHADISLGRFDRWLRWLVVTPDMHKVHHSDWRPETDSNYSTVFSFWDRLAGTFRSKRDPAAIHFGLEEFAAPRWQRWWGLWQMPFVDPNGPPATADAGQKEECDLSHV